MEFKDVLKVSYCSLCNSRSFWFKTFITFQEGGKFAGQIYINFKVVKALKMSYFKIPDKYHISFRMPINLPDLRK